MIFRIKQAAAVALAVVFGIVVLIMSCNVRQGVSDSIDLCISSVIPSLFLFTVIANFMMNIGLCEVLSRPLHRFSEFVFNLSGEEFCIFLLSLVSGYPVGATLLAKRLRLKKISKRRAEEMLRFCISAGPAFILISVGEFALGHRSDGCRLLFAHTLSSILLCFFSGLYNRFKKRDSTTERHWEAPLAPRCSVAEGFVTAAIDASKAMLNVCTFVIVFGAVGRLITTGSTPISPFFVNLLRGVIEVTNGVQLFGRGRLALIAFLLGFGGLSVHFQVLGILSGIKCRYFPLLLSRLSHGGLSALIIIIVEIVSPRYIDTLAQGTVKVSHNGNPLAVFSLMLLAVVLTVYSSHSLSKPPKFDTSCQNK